MAPGEILNEPLTWENLPEAIPLWPDRPLYSDAEFMRAMESAATLLRQRRAIGTLFRVGSQPRALGMSVFVRRSFADDYLKSPHPQLGKRVLLDAFAAHSPVLTQKEVGRSNFSGGLDLVVAATNLDATTTADRWQLFGTIFQCFIHAHAGYRLRRILHEVFGSANIDDVRVAGVFTKVAEFRNTGSARALCSLLGTLTIDEAIERRSTLLPMFLYRPPRMHLSASDQELLLAALEGGTDETLAARIGISTSGVKARWTRIQQKASKSIPEQFPCAQRAPRGSARGAQIRHIILRYVRNNPSELTPYMLTAEEPRRRRTSPRP